MYIYKITNKINSKVYIGQTIRPIEQRFHRHINDAMNNIIDTHFARAIRKYGPDNFYIELIDTANNQEELIKKEQYWINFYNSTNVGYNETDALYKSGGNTYKYKSKDEMNIISEKISISKSGSKNPNSKIIKCLNIYTYDELFFDTVNNCRIYFSETNHRFITTRVTGKIKSLYKNEWLISYYNNDYNFNIKSGRRGTKIRVFNYKTFENNEYDSINEMCRNKNIPKNIILERINNRIFYNNYVIDVIE